MGANRVGGGASGRGEAITDSAKANIKAATHVVAGLSLITSAMQSAGCETLTERIKNIYPCSRLDALPLRTPPMAEAITDPPAASCYRAYYCLFYDIEIAGFQWVGPDLFSSRACARGTAVCCGFGVEPTFAGMAFAFATA